MNFLINNITYLDYAIRGQIEFQDSATSIMQGIINLHHHIFFFILIVITFVFFIFYKTYDFSVGNFRAGNIDVFKDNNYFEKRQFLKKLNLCFNLNVNHGTILEIIGTIIPSLILLMIVGPSFTLLLSDNNSEYIYIPYKTLNIDSEVIIAIDKKIFNNINSQGNGKGLANNIKYYYDTYNLLISKVSYVSPNVYAFVNVKETIIVYHGKSDNNDHEKLLENFDLLIYYSSKNKIFNSSELNINELNKIPNTGTFKNRALSSIQAEINQFKANADSEKIEILDNFLEAEVVRRSGAADYLLNSVFFNNHNTGSAKITGNIVQVILAQGTYEPIDTIYSPDRQSIKLFNILHSGGTMNISYWWVYQDMYKLSEGSASCNLDYQLFSYKNRYKQIVELNEIMNNYIIFSKKFK